MQGQKYEGPRLQFRVPLDPEDSLDGYLYAVASAYSYPSPTVLLVSAGVVRTLRRKPDSITRLASMLKVPVHKLRLRAHRVQGATERNFLGSIIKGRHVVSNESRVCPECLREGRHHSALFDLVWNTACDRHRALLVGRCPDPTCGRPLRWGRPRLDRCSCGYDLRTLPVIRPSPESIHFASLLRRAAGLPKLGTGEEEEKPSFGWPEALYHADLPTVLDLVLLVMNQEPETRALLRYRSLRVDEAQKGFDVLVGPFLGQWPAGALAHLERTRNARLAEYRGKANPLSRRFSLSPLQLARTFACGVPRFVEEVRARHLAECTFAAPRQAGLDNPKWISVAETMKRLGVNRDVVRRFCDEGQLVWRQGGNGWRAAVAIDSVSVAELKDFRESAICREEATHRYGLSSVSFAGLRHLGLIKSSPQQAPSKGNSLVFDPKDIDSLFDQLHAASTAISQEAAQQKRGSFTALSKAQKVAGTIALMISGKLACFHVEGAPVYRLQSYYFHKFEAARVRRRHVATDVGLSPSEAARFLRCPLNYLIYMLSHRIFVPESLANQLADGRPLRWQRKIRFSADDILRFQRDLVAVDEIEHCNQHLDRGGRVSGRLRYHIAPVIPRGAVSRKQRIWFWQREIEPFAEKWGWTMPSVRSLPEADGTLRRWRRRR